jgi:hypothetical protein
MPLQATSGAASYDAFGGGAAAVPPYIEDVFSTYLYTGNSTTGGTQTITNNIDLSTKGGMVWIKGRSAASSNILTDTARGVGTSASNNQALSSNLTTAEDLAASYDFLSAFNTNGFAVTQGGTTAATRGANYNAVTYASWTLRKQSKFFDIVTYTGTGSNTTISHSLGSVPACIMVKRTDTTGAWQVYHRSLANTQYLVLNTTAAVATGATRWNSTTPTSTVFSLGTDATVNASAGTYVAYIFAHDAGGFGLTGTDNVISCGSYTGNGSSTGPVVTLGYEPQCLIIKKSSDVGNWQIIDNMRGMPVGSADATLQINLANAETSVEYVSPTATGFQITSTNTEVNSSAGTYIYIAIRRGPMRVPTSGTSVFGINARTGTGANATVTGGVGVTDFAMFKGRTVGNGDWASRITGLAYLTPAGTSSEGSSVTVLQASPWDVMDGVKVGTTSTSTNSSGDTFINYLFKRAPNFADIACYTGTGVNRTVAHNLQVAPELMFVKRRDTNASWAVYVAPVGATKYLTLNATDAATTSGNRWNDTTPTSSVFSVGTSTEVNASASTYIAYLFATCAGVSKVGSYTGTGTTQQIDCGFTTGARYVLIKRTSSTGDWFYWDSTRGIVAGNDPYLIIATSANEVTNTDYIDTYSAGFEISSTALVSINGNGSTFMFLAIA